MLLRRSSRDQGRSTKEVGTWAVLARFLRPNAQILGVDLAGRHGPQPGTAPSRARPPAGHAPQPGTPEGRA
jgi:hypothetical protein